MTFARTVRMTVNGTTHERTIDARVNLADFLRDELGLHGTHVGCEQGLCGACTVFVNGATARSCLVLAAQADMSEVVTVEGLADPNGELTRLQQAFREHYGLQCGFCTPGLLMCATELLAENRHPNEHQIREAIAGNLCRCTGYEQIVRAIHAVARAGGRDAPQVVPDSGVGPCATEAAAGETD